jgi:CHAT domain-containing protein/tetratricopeptide (TPR) repeat protein
MNFKHLVFTFFLLGVFFTNAQSDFPALKQKFLDFRKLDMQDSALFIARKMNQLAIKEQTDTSYWYALSMRYIGNPFNSLGINDSTIVYWQKSVELFEKYHPESSDFASGLNSLGVFYDEMGEYNVAEVYYRQALEIRKKIFGEFHPDYAQSLNNLGVLYRSIGDYKTAEDYYNRALQIKKKELGVEHPEYANSLLNLGVLHKAMGDYQSAETYYIQALEIRKIVLGDNHLDYAQSLNNLGVLYKELGDYKLAEYYYRQALEIRKKSLGENHPIYGSNLMNLGVLYSVMGDYKAAEPFFMKGFEIQKKALGEYHPDLAISMSNLGTFYMDKGDFKSSEVLIKKAIEISKKILGKEHPDYGACLSNLGVLYIALGEFNDAEALIKEALEIMKNVSGENYPDYVSTENTFAHLLTILNKEKEAFQILNDNFITKTTQISENFEWLTDNQKEAYWKKESVFYENLSWFANEVYEKVPESVGLNYNSALVTKSKMLEAKISSENYYREVDELREELAYRRRLLAKMESEGSTERDRMDKLRKEADSLDKRLTLSWPEYAQQKKNLSITWDQVQQNLEKGEAAIEFVRFYNEDDSLYYYNALVLKKGDSNPTLIKMCKEEDLTAITPKMGYSAYYPLIWQPLEIALVGIKTIYYAPSGELYNVPFHAIYAPKHDGDEVMAAKTDKRGAVIQIEKVITEQNAEYLIDRYTLHQLTSTRYLAMGLKQKEKENIGNNMAMVGGVNYDYLLGSQSAATKNKKNKKASSNSESASGKLDYLEGTKTEVEQIASSVTQNNWQTTLLENNDATEENIIKLENKEAKSILHIATHGYAFSEYDFNDSTISKNSLRYSYRYSTNPMVRSGLILAGGNWAWIGSDTLTKLGAEQNGILTALEVSQLNLKKTKLVVLSACETGLGKIEGAEGTFGLKRGFKLAGVEQIIVSLWSVPDKETMELMTLFYSDLTKTLDPVVSFEKAQREMRMKYPTEPEKWAGFVLVR